MDELADGWSIAHDDPDCPRIAEYFEANYHSSSSLILCAGCNTEVFSSDALDFVTQHRAYIVRVITEQGAEQHNVSQQEEMGTASSLDASVSGLS